jgi:aspartate dehydrogenase
MTAAPKERTRGVRVGIVGLGNIGRRVARHIDSGRIPGARLAAITSRDMEKVVSFCAGLAARPRPASLAEVCADSDIVIECATAAAFPDIARAVLKGGKSLIAVSAAGLPGCPEFLELAAASPGRVRFASGAMPGLDSIRSAAEGKITACRLTSTVLPSSFSGESILGEHGIDVGQLRERTRVFKGSAKEAAASFPRHFNVAISLNLAGVPLDLIQVELWVDPNLPGATVHIEVEAEDVSLTMMSKNIPSPENPRTSRIIAPSVLAALRGMIGAVQAGS